MHQRRRAALQQRIAATGDCECDRDGGDRLTVGTVDVSADNRTERAHAITTSEKGEVAVDETTNQRQKLGFDKVLYRRRRVAGVADVVWSTAEDDAGPSGEIDRS